MCTENVAHRGQLHEACLVLIICLRSIETNVSIVSAYHALSNSDHVAVTHTSRACPDFPGIQAAEGIQVLLAPGRVID